MKTRKFVLSVLGVAIASASVLLVTSPAGAGSRMTQGKINGNVIGSVDRCGDRFSAGIGTISGPGIPATTFTTSGLASFMTVKNGWEPASTELQPVSWVGRTHDPELGAMEWSFDVSRPVRNSTVRANQVSTDFPATLDLIYYIRGTIEAFPGVVFRSQIPVHVRTTQLMSYSPFIRETFSLVEPVPFEDSQRPGQVRFTLTNLSITMED